MKEFPSALQIALTKIGRKNGLAPNDSQDPANAALHYLYVDTVAKSLFTKQHKDSLDQIVSMIAPQEIKRLIDDTKKFDLGQKKTLLSSQDYSLELSTKRGAETLDKVALRNELVKLGVKSEIIEAAFAKATKQNEPAKSFIVNINGE